MILRRLSEMPTWIGNSKRRDEIRISGETGHAHVLKGDVYGDGGVGSIVVIKNLTEMTHDEHDAIVVEPGIYTVDAVRDYRDIVGRDDRYRFD